MKIKFVTPVVLALALAGCSDILSLEEEPQTFLSERQFFRNAADAEAATVAAYAPFQHFDYYKLRFVTSLLSMEDAVDGIGTYAPGALYRCDQVCMSRFWAAWTQMYNGINRANLVIARVPQVSMADTKKQELLGEAHFVRALNYYNLVRYWGAVPLRLEPVEGYSSLALPKSPAEAVYRQIVSDLEFAEARLPNTRPVSEVGRASRWAATLLLADVYLAQENWAQAAAKAKQVIDSGRFSLVQVSTANDFDRLYGPAVVTSPERIFDIPFVSTNGFGMEIPSALHHPNSGYAARPYRALYGNLRSYLGSWDPNDLRYSYNLYVGADTRHLTAVEQQRFKKFKDPAAVDRQAHANDFPILRYADALLIFAEATAMASGPNAAAYDAVNQIRRRAYGRPLNASAPGVDLPAGLSREAFRDAVILERAYEFTAEAKRYWDLKRTGKLGPAILASGDPYDPKYMLWPLPQDELDANEALSLVDQNPGW